MLRPLKSTRKNNHFAPVAQWIEQRFPNSSGCVGVDGNCVDVDGYPELAAPAATASKSSIVGEKTIEDGSSEKVIETALAMAIAAASTAGRWEIVAFIARELQVRRTPGAGPPKEGP